MMMGLGQFVFSLSTLAYQDLQRQTQWRHPSSSRVGAAPARQFVGPGDDSIALQGLLVPELAGDTGSLDELREMADTGAAWPLVEGTGRVCGFFVIESLTEGRTLFFQDGASRRIEFTINLQRVDDDRVERIGLLTGSRSGAIA